MYEVDANDRVIALTGVPPCDAGAPMPQLLATEQRLLLAYLGNEHVPDFDGTHVQMVDSETEGSVVIIDVLWPTAHFWGLPNDEAIAGHPLASRGVECYGVYEIENSSWIRKLEQMNSVHRLHNKMRFMDNKKHYIFTFHDTTFECIARGFKFITMQGTLNMAFDRMFNMAKMPSPVQSPEKIPSTTRNPWWKFW